MYLIFTPFLGLLFVFLFSRLNLLVMGQKIFISSNQTTTKTKNRSQFIVLFFIFIITAGTSFAQITGPYTVNIAGNQVTKGNFAIEWSVGESAAINIMDNSNQYVFTNGLLQYNVENQTEINKIASFLPNEIRVYPNPVRNELSINILHASKGNHQIELLDEKGTKLKEKIIKYNGMGALENWNLSGLKAGQYFLNIRQTEGVTGKLIKKGAYKIVKIN